MDTYFEAKKRDSLIFTQHNINPSNPYISMMPNTRAPIPVETPGEISFWSHLSGRYRTAKEQAEFESRGLIDVKLDKVPQE